MQHDPILEIFREEAREHLGALEKSFLDLEAAPSVEARRALIDNLFRHAHSLKSDAKVVGLTSLKEASQHLEDILDDLREKPQSVDRAAINRGLAQFDKVRAAFEAWHKEDDAGSVLSVSPATPSVPLSPPPPAQLPPSRFVEPPVELPAPMSSTEERESVPESDENFTVRVPSERLDRMLNLAGEVRICQRSGETLSARLGDLREHLGGMLRSFDRCSPLEYRQLLETALDQVRRIDGELRKKRSREELLLESLETDIREARLLPLLMLAESLRRVVRDLAQTLNKSIKYEVRAGGILLDKAVLEALKNPLMHLARNACDHGIEPPEERVAAGKPVEGTIRLGAAQTGQMVEITVSDDGRGVYYDRIRERIRTMGMLNETGSADLSERDLIEYLFQPGFTTAPRGDISGRGVGLDAARDAIRRLHGDVELRSSSPAGTTFVITVPVTVSTLRILTVEAAGTYYGIPTTTVSRTGRARREDLRELAGNLFLPLEGRPVRWLHLAELLGVQAQPAPSERAWSYLLLGGQKQQLAVAVDDLEDETEVLLKPLGFPLHSLAGFKGAAIRPNGAVQLVLDLSSSIWTSTVDRSAHPRLEPMIARQILVVDDSPTTRAILRKVFTAAGYAVTTASDGMDALERLRSRRIDLVVSDVEMPRLNGFDLTRNIKAKFGLPVILVTGREKEDHRREGLAAGADAYVVKSTFEGAGLLEIVRQFV